MILFIWKVVVGAVVMLMLSILEGLAVGAVIGGAVAVLAVLVGNDGAAAFVRVAPWVAVITTVVLAILKLVLWFQCIADTWAQVRIKLAEQAIEKELAER